MHEQMNISIGTASCTNAQRNWIYLDVSTVAFAFNTTICCIESRFPASNALLITAHLMYFPSPLFRLSNDIFGIIFQSRIKNLEPLKKIKVPKPGLRRDIWLVRDCILFSPISACFNLPFFMQLDFTCKLLKFKSRSKVWTDASESEHSVVSTIMLCFRTCASTPGCKKYTSHIFLQYDCLPRHWINGHWKL